MAPHGTRIDIHLQTELDLEQLSDRYRFTLKQTASTATQKQTKKTVKPQFHVFSCSSLLKKKKYRRNARQTMDEISGGII